MVAQRRNCDRLILRHGSRQSLRIFRLIQNLVNDGLIEKQRYLCGASMNVVHGSQPGNSMNEMNIGTMCAREQCDGPRGPVGSFTSFTLFIPFTVFTHSFVHAVHGRERGKMAALKCSIRGTYSEAINMAFRGARKKMAPGVPVRGAVRRAVVGPPFGHLGAAQ
jgi:hypothetical protein